MKSRILAVIAASAILACPAPVSAGRYKSEIGRAAPTIRGTVRDYWPLAVSVPHHLNRAEARRRVKNALAGLQKNYGYLLAIEQEIWTGYRLRFRARVLGQTAVGKIDVTKDHVKLRVLLPPSLMILGVIAQPIVRKAGTSILAKK